jgi:hypothetical protein
MNICIVKEQIIQGVVKKESVVDSETWEIVDKVKSKYN